jgi:hypothetical protein
VGFGTADFLEADGIEVWKEIPYLEYFLKLKEGLNKIRPIA